LEAFGAAAARDFDDPDPTAVGLAAAAFDFGFAAASAFAAFEEGAVLGLGLAFAVGFERAAAGRFGSFGVG